MFRGVIGGLRLGMRGARDRGRDGRIRVRGEIEVEVGA